MNAKRLLALALCLLMCAVWSPARPARAAGEYTLTVTHATEGSLDAEIGDARGMTSASAYGKLKIILTSAAALSGDCRSGDWQVLYTLPTLLPNVTELELVYAGGSHSIPKDAMSNSVTGAAWLHQLTLTTAGGSLTIIGEFAFGACPNLGGRLVIPGTVTSIRDYAFYGCSGLTGVDLTGAASLTMMGACAFLDCSGLTGTVALPTTLSSLYPFSFQGCAHLDALVFRTPGSISMDSDRPITDQSGIAVYYPMGASYASELDLHTSGPKVPYVPATAALFTHFYLAGARGVIDNTNRAVLLTLPAGTDLTGLTPDMYFIGSSVSPTGAQDFSARMKPYTITPVSGSPVTYAVKLASQPTVSGSNALTGTAGYAGDQAVTAALNGSCPEEITFTASIGGKTATVPHTGDGDVSFPFLAADLNALAAGSYDILVSAPATQANAAIPETKVGTLDLTAPSADASLAELALSSGTLSPAFDSGIFAYEAGVANEVSGVTVTATPNDPLAVVAVSGGASKGVYGSIPLNVGKNEITVTVTAPDGVTVRTYTLTLTRDAAPSADASLSALSLSAGTLSPAFDSGTLAYEAGVGNAVGEVTVTATAHDPQATVGVRGPNAPKGVYGPIPLNVGKNVITVTVTAPDGVTVKTYTVTVTRDAPMPATGDGGPWVWVMGLVIAGAGMMALGMRRRVRG